jgi:hypothetical protein
MATTDFDNEFKTTIDLMNSFNDDERLAHAFIDTKLTLLLHRVNADLHIINQLMSSCDQRKISFINGTPMPYTARFLLTAVNMPCSPAPPVAHPVHVAVPVPLSDKRQEKEDTADSKRDSKRPRID